MRRVRLVKGEKTLGLELHHQLLMIIIIIITQDLISMTIGQSNAL
jgi:hypothetical protein